MITQYYVIPRSQNVRSLHGICICCWRWNRKYACNFHTL